MAERVEQVLRVGGGSSTRAVGGALVKFLDEGVDVVLSAVGAGAVNQMTKAIIEARSMAARRGLDLYFIPGFYDEMVGSEMKTSIRFYVKVK